MNDEIIMGMLYDLEEAQNALKPRGEQFPNCMEKITTMVRYWRNLTDRGGEIRAEDIEPMLETLHIVRDIVRTYLQDTGWKDRHVEHTWHALANVFSNVQSFEKL